MKKIIVPVFILLCVSLVLFLPGFLKVNKISCVSQFGPCNLQITSELEAVSIGSIYETKKAITKILGKNIFVSNFSLDFEIPDRLSVAVVERKPVMAFNKVGSDKFVLVDDKGLIITESSQTQLPTIYVKETFPFDYFLGGTISDRLQFASKLLAKLGVMYSINAGEVESDMLKVRVETFEVVFPFGGDVDLLLGSLVAILSRINDGVDQISFDIIDLRFDNPVLR